MFGPFYSLWLLFQHHEDKDVDRNHNYADEGPISNSNVIPLPKSDAPILIIFVLGGVTFSETRAAYEVSRQLGCEVLIGTPKDLH